MATIKIKTLAELKTALTSPANSDDYMLDNDITINEPITVTTDKKLMLSRYKLMCQVSKSIEVTKGKLEITGGQIQVKASSALVVTGASNPAELKLHGGLSIQVDDDCDIVFKTKGKLTLDHIFLASNSTLPAITGQFTDATVTMQECSATTKTGSFLYLEKGAKAIIIQGVFKLQPPTNIDLDKPFILVKDPNSSLNIDSGKYNCFFSYLLHVQNGAKANLIGTGKYTTSSINRPSIILEGQNNTLNIQCTSFTSETFKAIQTTDSNNTLNITSGQIIATPTELCLDMPQGNSLNLTAKFKGKLINDYLPSTHQWSAKDGDGYQTVELKPVAPPPPPQPGTGEDPGQPQPPQPPVNPPQPPVNPGGGGTQPPQPPQPQELGKSLNIIRTIQLYQTPSRRYPISEWEGPVQILSDPITEQGTGEKFVLVRVKLQGIGTWLTSYIRWNTTNNTPIADEFSRR